MNNEQSENLYTTNCIRTFTGKYVNVFDLNMNLDTIVIEDIAHALAREQRFGNHLPVYFSVAQHSLNCMKNVPDDLKLEALLHDAAEAYMRDLPRPIKINLYQYKEIESNIEHAIAKKFTLQYPFPDAIKRADKYHLECEWETYMLPKPSMFRKVICFIRYIRAKRQFLKAFKKLERV